MNFLLSVKKACEGMLAGNDKTISSLVLEEGINFITRMEESDFRSEIISLNKLVNILQEINSEKEMYINQIFKLISSLEIENNQ